jgi:IclR family transcriptional regulator, acetate operon repressor
MRRRPVRSTPAVQSLDRGLSILEAVGQSAQPVPLKQLTALLGIDRSNAFRLANTLRQRRFLANAARTNEFVLGPSAWRLANQCGRSRLIAVCHDHVRALAEAAGETAHLAVREGSQALLVDHAVAQGRVVMVAGLSGEYVGLYNTAHGKVLLADCELAELRTIFAEVAFTRTAKRTLVSLDRIAAACAKARVEGTAIDDREFLDEVRCAAAAIRDASGRVVASVGISAPMTRFTPRRFAAGRAQVAAAAQAIMKALAG